MENRFTNMERRENLRGMSIALIGGIFWGLAGVFGQYLFEYNGDKCQMARQCKTYHCRPAAAFYSMDQTKRYLLENMDKKERCPDSAAFFLCLEWRDASFPIIRQ